MPRAWLGLHVLLGDLSGAIKGRRKVMKVRKLTLKLVTKQCSYLKQRYLMAVPVKPYRYALFWDVMCWEEQHKSANSNLLTKGFFLQG